MLRVLLGFDCLLGIRTKSVEVLLLFIRIVLLAVKEGVQHSVNVFGLVVDFLHDY